MKFVDIKGTQNILTIDIIPSKLDPTFEYYYPDGITKGVFKRKTYFVGKKFWDGTVYYKTPQEAIEGRSKFNFIKEGKIWEFGRIIVTLRSALETANILDYEDTKDLLSYLETLNSRWGVDLHSLVCLESLKVFSLYEYINELRSQHL